MITSANYPIAELAQLWTACARPGSNVMKLKTDPLTGRKLRGGFYPIEQAATGQFAFAVQTPHHLFPLDVDVQHVESGLGQKILDAFNQQEIIYVASTSGSKGWTVIVNLWSLAPILEGNRFDDRSLQEQSNLLTNLLFKLAPDSPWTGGNGILRRNQAIRPPLSPYPGVGELKLIFPSSPAKAVSMLNWGGIGRDGIKQPNSTMLNHIHLRIPVEQRHSRYASFALSMVNAGYHLEDFKYALTNVYMPIGKEFLNRGKFEYQRQDQAMIREIESTWSNAIDFATENPKSSDAKRFIPKWLLASIETVKQSNISSQTKNKLVTLNFAIASAALKANTSEPTLAESRLTKLSGISNRSISRYKQIGKELGLWTLSESPTNYGTMFTLSESIVEFTDIKSLYYLLGDREVISVNQVNELHTNHQINNCLSVWEPHYLWHQFSVCGSNGHLVWHLIHSFPHLQKSDIQKVLGWSNRQTDKVIDTLESYGIIFKDTRTSAYSAPKDLDQWEFVSNLIKPKLAIRLAC